MNVIINWPARITTVICSFLVDVIIRVLSFQLHCGLARENISIFVFCSLLKEFSFLGEIPKSLNIQNQICIRFIKHIDKKKVNFEIHLQK